MNTLRKTVYSYIQSQRTFKNFSQGSTLIEAMIALSAIVIVLTATSSLVITSLNNSTFNRDQNQANKLAQQGVEYVRDKVANKEGFTDFVALSGAVRCMKGIENGEIEITAGLCDGTDRIDDTYSREILLTHNAPDCVAPTTSPSSPLVDTLKATVTVYFQSGKCSVSDPFCHKQEVSSCFQDPGNGTTEI